MSISLTDAVAGQAILASLINNNNTTLETEINGALADANLSAAAAIALSKLADAGVATGNLMRFDGTDWAKFQPPGCRANRTTTQSISNNASTAVQLNAADSHDTGALHDTSTNNTRITVATAGIYLIQGQIDWAASTIGRRGSLIRLNGATELAKQNLSADADDPVVQVVTLYSLAASDYVELLAYQNSGGSLNLDTAHLSVQWVGHV